MPKILLVEDNEENRDALSRRLHRRGYEMVFAATGIEAVARAATQKPDLILMDVNLPELDGWEATRRIKASPEGALVPIIALTAHAMTGDREKALAAGCADHHAKPVDFPRLLAQIEAHLPPQSRQPTGTGDSAADAVASHKAEQAGQKDA
jgi:CheY-like chemotaxis protein